MTRPTFTDSAAAPDLPPAPASGWWRWLSSPVLGQHAARYAGLLIGLNVVAWLLVGLADGNVLDRRLPIVLFPLSGFIIWVALVFYRRRRDTAMGFGRGLKLGALIAALSSGGLALLLGGLVLLGGETLRQRHIATTAALLNSQRERLETMPDGKALFAEQLAAAQHLNAGALALDEGVRRLFPALIAALLGAILLRKANPEGTEPERAPRAPKT